MPGVGAAAENSTAAWDSLPLRLSRISRATPCTWPPCLTNASAVCMCAQVLPVTDGTRVALAYELFARPGMHNVMRVHYVGLPLGGIAAP